MSGVGPGWYADPEGRPHERYWDGMAWTEQTRPLTTATDHARPAVSGAPRNGMGVAALVLGILGIFVLPIVLSLLAIIFGGLGIGRAKRGEATNKTMATIGMWLGIIGLVFGLLLVAWLSG